MRPRLVHQLDFGVVLDRPHEGVGHADRDVEVGEVALVLGVDEFLDVGWSQRSTPIWRPRRLPADSTVSQERSKTRMYDTGPLARERVPLTSAPLGRMAEKS